MKRGYVIRSIILLFLIIISILLLIADEITDKPDGGGLTKDEGGLGTDDSTTSGNSATAISLDKNQLSYQWLLNKTTDNTNGVSDDSLAIIALLGSGNLDLTQLVDRLKNKMDKNVGCWPNNGCKVKDTSLATLAMYAAGQDEEAIAGIKWLKEARIPGLRGGEGWWLVIKGSSGDGSCIISYKGRSKTFNFKEDKIKELGGKSYINLLQIDPTILSSGILPVLNVDCSNLPGSIITLLYKPNVNSFFIQKSETAANAEFKVSNSCFGEAKSSGNCDYESSLYATWALLEMGDSGLKLDEIGDNIYLQSKIKNINIKDLALLNRILYLSSSTTPSFVTELASKQKSGGDWDGDSFTSALSIFGLSGNTEQSDVVNRGVSYIERRRSPKDGLWDNSVRNTAMALIALHGVDLAKSQIADASIPSKGRTSKGSEDCTNDLDDDGDTFADCGDSDCEEDKKTFCSNDLIDGCEEQVDCGGFCSSCEDKGLSTTTTEECKLDSECDTGQECSSGNCVDKREEGCKTNDECSSNEQCVSGKCLPKEESSLWWLWLIIIIVILGGAGGFIYVKYVKTGKIDLKHLFKKKTRGPTFEEFRIQNQFRPANNRPNVKPSNGSNQANARQPNGTRPANASTGVIRPNGQNVKSKEDLELERSIKEAERLIKGK